MTRPGMVRADTLDLQDQSSPSAQDHSQKPRQNPRAATTAPHQAAELRHVQEERHIEEETLSGAWHTAAGLSDEPPSDDVVTRSDMVQLQLLGPDGQRKEEADNMDGEEEDENVDDDVLDKISSSPSITDEDIDFEFVYALHTFVATVEGQANAQKGDTMVLLDDSNSYWWLVRVVKDSTIGYLPAEHIETPTERLARLNKHRNVDLSQTMLGDTTEKTKNPLKKAMRRRNPKKVNFAQPTYIEPSEYEYTTDEDSGDEISLTEIATSNTIDSAKDEITVVDEKDINIIEPLSTSRKLTKPEVSPERHAESDDAGRRRKIDEERVSDEQLDREYTPEKHSRNGVVRNTDSFFRDESIETRKITLTPNILRDDSSNAEPVLRGSIDRGSGLDLLKEDPKPAKSGKKEKKSGMLSGLFKRKDKKGKSEDSKARHTPELARSSLSSEEALLNDRPSTSDGLASRPSSKSKLQTSPTTGSSQSLSTAPTSLVKKAGSAEPPSNDPSPHSSPERSLEKQSSLRARASESVSGISSKLHISSASSETPKPLKVKRAKTREALDVDSSPEEEASDPFSDPARSKQQVEAPLQAPPAGSGHLAAVRSTERLSASPEHITKADAISSEGEPPALVGDSSSNSSADELTSLRSSPSPPTAHSDFQQSAPLTTYSSSVPPPPTRLPPPQPSTAPSPPTAQRSVSAQRNNSASPADSRHTASTSASCPAWSDAHLKAYMDSTNDIKDLLVMVHDTSGVVPAGPDHPLMSNLFVEERGKVKDLDSSLNRLLDQWLTKKRGTPAKSRANGVKGGSRLAHVSNVSL